MSKKKIILFAAAITSFVSLQSSADHGEETWAIEFRKFSIRINPDYTYEEIKEETTLIRSQSVIDSFGQEEYTYSSDSESVEVLEAYTILPNGEKIAVQPEQIRTTVDQVENGEASYSDDHHKIIIFPNLVAGAKTHYKIKKTVHKPLYPDRFFEAYYFRPNIEYIRTEVDIEFPSSLPIKTEVRGPIQFKTEEINGIKRHFFTFSQRELRTLEDGDVSPLDVSPAIFISSFRDYADFAEVNQLRSQTKAIVTEEIRNLAEKLTENVTDPFEKARILYNWVALNIRYVGVYFGDGGVVPHSSEETLRNLHGDCKDKSNLLISLLKAVGIESENAMINSGSAYQLPPLPVHYPINHVITYIPQFNLFVDATQERAPFGILGFEIQGKPAILEKSRKIAFTPVPTIQSERVVTNITLDIDRDGNINGHATSRFFGDRGITARWFFDFVDKNEEKESIENHFYRFRESGVGEFTSMDDVKTLNEPMSMESTFVLDPISNIPGPGAIKLPVGLSPGGIDKLTYRRPSSDSQFPYQCNSDYIEENYIISFPEGVRITRIPESVDITIGANTYRAKYERLSDSRIKVVRTFTSDRDHVVCSNQDFENWKKIFPFIKRDVISQIFYE